MPNTLCQPESYSFQTISILDKDVNGCGRGINVVVIDAVSRAIVSVSNFDTYNKDSSALETVLLSLRPGDIMILLTFDEPSMKLSRVARLLLHEIGSGKAQNLNFRTSWYLITQKGIEGYSPFEEIHLPDSKELMASVSAPPMIKSKASSSKSVWAKPHDVKICVPLQSK